MDAEDDIDPDLLVTQKVIQIANGLYDFFNAMRIARDLFDATPPMFLFNNESKIKKSLPSHNWNKEGF